MAGGITLSTDFQNAMKEVYGSGSDLFKNQQNLSAKFYKRLKVGLEKPSELGVIVPVSMTGNEAGRSVNENENFELAGDYKPERPTIKVKEYIHPFAFSGRLIELSKSGTQAFSPGAHEIMNDAMERAQSNLNRQFIGTGTGQLALVVGAVVATTTMIVDEIIPFRRGMKIDAFTAVGGAKQIDAVVIDSIDVSTNTIELASAESCDNNSILVLSGTLDNAPVDGKEIAGFRKCCDTTTFGASYEGLTVAANPEWQGNVIAAGGVPVSQDLMQQTVDRAWIVGNSEPKLMMSNVGQRRNFLATEVQQTRYENSKIDAGYTVLKWNDLTWVVEKDYPIGEIAFIDQENFKRYETRALHIADHDKNTILRVTGRNAVSGYYEYFGTGGSWKRSTQARLAGLTDPLSSGLLKNLS